jgi:hypothetical protein
MSDDLGVLFQAIERDIDIAFAKWPGGYPGNIELALLDAVSGVGKRVLAYRELRGISELASSPCDDLAVLAAFDTGSLKKVCGHQKIAGVPKVDVIQTGARALVDAGVRHAADLQATNEDHKKAYTSVRGLGPVTWSYFGMLLGTSDVKADTMIVRYVSRQLRRVVESGEARRMLLLVAERLRQEPRALDHAVWRFERDPNNRRRELS